MSKIRTYHPKHLFLRRQMPLISKKFGLYSHGRGYAQRMSSTINLEPHFRNSAQGLCITRSKLATARRTRSIEEFRANSSARRESVKIFSTASYACKVSKRSSLKGS